MKGTETQTEADIKSCPTYNSLQARVGGSGFGQLHHAALHTTNPQPHNKYALLIQVNEIVSEIN